MRLYQESLTSSSHLCWEQARKPTLSPRCGGLPAGINHSSRTRLSQLGHAAAPTPRFLLSTAAPQAWSISASPQSFCSRED